MGRGGEAEPVNSLVVKEAVNRGATVEVTFSDGFAVAFHALWLRDCAPDTHDLSATAEKVVEKTPIVFGRGDFNTFTAEAKAASVTPEGDLAVEFGNGDVVERGTYGAKWLRAYGAVAGKPLAGSTKVTPEEDFFSFLEENRGPEKSGLSLWDATLEIPRVKYETLKGSDPAQLKLLETIMDPGIVIVENMPEDEMRDATVMNEFVQTYLGGLQKHPLRTTANWTISTEDLTTMGGDEGTVADVSGYGGAERTTRAYNTDLQLQQHTDQSAYTQPGLLLLFHCADGQGGNTVTDGFKVAYQMKEEFPEEFEAISTLAYNLGRRVEHYRNGVQLQIVAKPIVRVDEVGRIAQIRYHELYRSAFTLPFDDFPRYYKALAKFYELVHSPENMKQIVLHKREMLIMNNWRTMHGRAGLAGRRRTIIGGTVAVNNFVSQVRLVKERLHGLGMLDTLGTPLSLFSTLTGEI